MLFENKTVSDASNANLASPPLATSPLPSPSAVHIPLPTGVQVQIPSPTGIRDQPAVDDKTDLALSLDCGEENEDEEEEEENQPVVNTGPSVPATDNVCV